MSIFRFHRRNLTKIFLTKNPNDNLTKRDNPSVNLMLDLYDLSNNFDLVLDKVFQFENLFTHKVYDLKKNDLKFFIKYKPEFLSHNNSERIYEIPIRDKYDNFLKSKNSQEIRVS